MKLIVTFLFCLSLFAKDLEITKIAKDTESYREAQNIYSDRGDLKKKANTALDNLIATTVRELKDRGHESLASSIMMDYQQRYRGFMYSFKPGRPIGDHEAIAWLKKIHDDIHFVLGDKLCEATRAHDLLIFAYCIPIVFSCEDNVDIGEYAMHFIPFIGCLSYWISYGVCAGVSLIAAPPLMFFCGIIGYGVERATVALIAPTLLQPSYNLACTKKP